MTNRKQHLTQEEDKRAMNETKLLNDRHLFPWAPRSSHKLYQYKGYWETEGVCGLQVGKNEATGEWWVIFTELPINKGASVTNMIEKLASQLAWDMNIPVNRFLIFEHYPKRGASVSPIEENWDLVQPDWIRGKAKAPNDRRMWKRVTRAEALEMIGAPPERTESEETSGGDCTTRQGTVEGDGRVANGKAQRASNAPPALWPRRRETM